MIFPASTLTSLTPTGCLAGRVRTDLGGVYFNAIFVIGATVVYTFIPYPAIILAIVFIHFAMIEQMLPLVRLDGYYVLSDLIGVPDLFGRIKPILLNLIPGRHDPRVKQLRASARRIVAAWVLIVVPVLVGSFALFLWRLPRLAHDTYDSFQVQWADATFNFDEHHWAALALSAVAVVLLLIPVLGLLALLVRIVKKIPRHTTRRRA
jgi:putative peptide zinc metalloprotease protein